MLPLRGVKLMLLTVSWIGQIKSQIGEFIVVKCMLVGVVNAKGFYSMRIEKHNVKCKASIHELSHVLVQVKSDSKLQTELHLIYIL